MRHRKAGFKLGRNTSHRRALLRNLVTSILMEDRVETTVTKAKAARPHVEKMITLGKRGGLHARRQALSVLRDTVVTAKLFDELAERFKDRPGGYTRVIKAGYRYGDMAPLGVIELVDRDPDAKGQDSGPTMFGDDDEAEDEAAQAS